MGGSDVRRLDPTDAAVDGLVNPLILQASDGVGTVEKCHVDVTVGSNRGVHALAVAARSEHRGRRRPGQAAVVRKRRDVEVADGREIGPTDVNASKERARRGVVDSDQLFVVTAASVNGADVLEGLAIGWKIFKIGIFQGLGFGVFPCLYGALKMVLK